MKNASAISGLLAGALLSAPLANAQVQPPLDDAVVQGEILNRAVDQATTAPRPRDDDELNEIDGEAGIYVLTQNDIFFVSASAGAGHTTNPTRTATDAGADWYGDFSASLGVNTRLGGAVDFAASVSVDGRDYIDTDAASSRGVSVTTAVGAPVLDWLYASAVVFGGYAFDHRFDNETSFYGLSATLSAPIKLSDQLVIRPGLGVTQQWSGVYENNSLAATASVDALYAIAPGWMLAGRASVTQRTYDDFYEDVTFVEREDTTAGVSTSLVWRPASSIAVSMNLAYEKQDSSFFLSEFDAFDKGVSLSFRQVF